MSVRHPTNDSAPSIYGRKKIDPVMPLRNLAVEDGRHTKMVGI